MEGEAPALKVTEPKLTYEAFKQQAQTEALDFVSTIAQRDGLGSVTDEWDILEPQIPYLIDDIKGTTAFLKETLDTAGLSDLPDDLNTIEDETVRQIANEYKMCVLLSLDVPYLADDVPKEIADLEDRVEKPSLNSSFHHSFFKRIAGIDDYVHDYQAVVEQILLRAADSKRAEEAKERIESVLESVTKILTCEAPLKAASDIKGDAGIQKHLASWLRRGKATPLIGIAQFASGASGLGTEDEIVLALDNEIDGILKQWLEEEGDFLNIDEAPEEFKETLQNFIQQADPAGAPLPSCIVGEALDKLISDDIDEKIRTRFMYVYSLRSLIRWDSDQYLSALYEERVHS